MVKWRNIRKRFYLAREFKGAGIHLLESDDRDKLQQIKDRSNKSDIEIIHPVAENDNTRYYHCRLCGHIALENQFGKQVMQEMIDKELCSGCYFAMKLIEHIPPEGARKIVVGQEHYIMYPWESGEGAFRGSSGQPYFARFDDGSIMKSNNVWMQGEIPENMLDKFTWRGKFITEEEYRQLGGC